MLLKTRKTAFSTLMFLLYANCHGSRKSVTKTWKCIRTTLSNTLITLTAYVSATGRRLFIDLMGDFFGTGTMQEVFLVGGILHWARDWLKMTQSLEHSCSVQCFKMLGLIPSGPAALFGFVLWSCRRTLSTVTVMHSPLFSTRALVSLSVRLFLASLKSWQSKRA